MGSSDTGHGATAEHGQLLSFLSYLYDRFLVLIVPFATLLFLGAYTTLTYSNNLATRENFEASQRPYVGIGQKDGSMGTFIESKDPNKKAGVLLYFHNGGQSPALNFHVQLFSAGASTPEHMARLVNEDGFVVEQVPGSISFFLRVARMVERSSVFASALAPAPDMRTSIHR